MAKGIERMHGGRLFRTRWLPVLAYVALIFTLSAQPGLRVPGPFAFNDKIGHTLEYGGLGVLVFRAARASWPGVPALRRALMTLVAVSALGALDEKFQSFIPGRDSTVYDWMADTFGVSLAQAASVAVARRRGGA